jgi:hypothetical protein
MNGEINITVSGATSPYTFAWSGPGNTLFSSEDLTGIPPGSYEVIVTDENGCIRNQNINLPASNNFSFSIGADTTICQGTSLTLEGPANCTYNWSTGDSAAILILPPDAFTLGNHPIILTAINENHCIYSDVINLEVMDCNVGISENTSKGIYLYPNPTRGRFFASSAHETGMENIEIFDAMGHLVFDQPVGNSGIIIDAQLAAGIYKVRITSGGVPVTLPLVVH